MNFPPFYYEVKLVEPVKPNGRYVFTTSGTSGTSELAVQLEKTEGRLWGEQP